MPLNSACCITCSNVAAGCCAGSAVAAKAVAAIKRSNIGRAPVLNCLGRASIRPAVARKDAPTPSPFIVSPVVRRHQEHADVHQPGHPTLVSGQLLKLAEYGCSRRVFVGQEGGPRADPLVRGRRPRRPASVCMMLILLIRPRDEGVPREPGGPPSSLRPNPAVAKTKWHWLAN